jgi:hypothetical protein
MQDFELENQLAMQRYQQALAEQNKPFTSPQGKMVGNIYVRSNPLEGLIQGLRMKQAKDERRGAEQELKDLRGKRQETEARDMSAFVSALRGTPAQASTTTPTQMPSFDEADAQSMQGVQGYGATTGAQAATPGDPMAAYSLAAASQSPTVRQMGMQGIAQMPQMEAQKQERVDARNFRQTEADLARQARADEAAANRAQRMQELQMRSEDQRLSQQERLAAQRENRDLMMQNQREMAKLQASLRPERNVTVLGPNGEAITVPQSQSQGLPLYNPQAAATMQKEKTKGQAKEQLSGVVQQLNNSYNALEQGGGITSTNRGTLANIGASIGASGVGQALGGAVGTENQRQRQEIQQTRPLLLNLIKEATGMSAQQMNSNAEMQLYLQAATDPKLSVEANRSALANLDRMFGLGIAKPPADAAKTPAAGANPQDAEALKWARSNPNDPRSKTILQRLGQ